MFTCCMSMHAAHIAVTSRGRSVAVAVEDRVVGVVCIRPACLPSLGVSACYFMLLVGWHVAAPIYAKICVHATPQGQLSPDAVHVHQGQLLDKLTCEAALCHTEPCLVSAPYAVPSLQIQPCRSSCPISSHLFPVSHLSLPAGGVASTSTAVQQHKSLISSLRCSCNLQRMPGSQLTGSL